jgi:Ca2+-transporting ATPase
LTSAEARRLLAEHGPNALPEVPPVPLWRRFLRQLRSALIYVLILALVVDVGAWLLEGSEGVPFEAIAIAAILLLNAVLGVWQEYRAENTLASLRELEAPQAWLFRDGRLERRPSRDLVPGDVVRIAAGARVPADARVDGEQGLLVDESVLSGESIPVDKAQDSQVFAGTLVVRGAAYAQVTQTGSASSMGRIAGMLGEVRTDRTPLEQRLDVFGAQIARWVLVISVVLVAGNVAVEGWARLDDAFLWAVALAVAAIPEGLPAVLTLTLALGVERMSKRRAVVRKLAAVEALGSVTVIATDKTGTITENRMLVRQLDSPDSARAVRAMVLASDAEPDAGCDPLEDGLFAYAREQGVDPVAVRLASPRHGERSFDSTWKFMRVTVDEGGAPVSYLKGAPEVLLARSDLDDSERRRWAEKAERHAAEGLRVLALAWGHGEREQELQWLGLVLFWDPPRAEVSDAVRAARDAGVRVLMITGDHPATAASVARMVGIDGARAVTGEQLDGLDSQALSALAAEADVFARVTPEHKMALVEVLRARGEVVAVTGDGVNDAPALKCSDVGIAMGRRGSDVSREVADLVLLDDNFATIVAAIEEGRNIYANIQTFIRFLFSTNVALVVLVAIGAVGAAAFGLRDAAGALLVPLTAAQLLWVAGRHEAQAAPPPRRAVRSPGHPLRVRDRRRQGGGGPGPADGASPRRPLQHRHPHRGLPVRDPGPAGVRVPVAGADLATGSQPGAQRHRVRQHPAPARHRAAAGHAAHAGTRVDRRNHLGLGGRRRLPILALRAALHPARPSAESSGAALSPLIPGATPPGVRRRAPRRDRALRSEHARPRAGPAAPAVRRRRGCRQARANLPARSPSCGTTGGPRWVRRPASRANQARRRRQGRRAAGSDPAALRRGASGARHPHRARRGVAGRPGSPTA